MKQWILVLFIISLCFFSSQGSWAKQKSQEVSNESVVKEDYVRLQTAIRSNDEQAILKAASEVLSKNSKDLKALNALGLFYFSRKQLGMARLVYNRALKDHKNEPGLHNNLGVTYLEEGDLRRAIMSFEKAISLKKSYSVASINLSSIFAEYGDYRRALKPLESGYRAFKLKSAKSEAEKKMAIQVTNNYAVVFIGLEKTENAQRVLKAALDVGIDDTFLLYNYAILLVDILKDREKALKIVSKLKFSTDDPSLLRKVTELEERLDKL